MIRITLFLLFIGTFSNCTNKKIAKEIVGKVVSIADGDTFTLLTVQKQQIKIRLYGIDCPEKTQDFGKVAKQKLAELIFGKQIRTVKKDIDRYGRTVAIAYDEQGRCINEEMLAAGLAWHYSKYDNNPAWSTLEENAKNNRLGLWIQLNPTPPWEWRHQ